MARAGSVNAVARRSATAVDRSSAKVGCSGMLKRRCFAVTLDDGTVGSDGRGPSGHGAPRLSRCTARDAKVGRAPVESSDPAASMSLSVTCLRRAGWEEFGRIEVR
jgi:hypothetical protein